MLVDLGLRDRKWALAFTRSDQQETNIRSIPMHQRRGLEQRRNALSPRHTRDGDDDRGRAETELFSKLTCRRGLGQSPSESFDVDPAAAGRDHEAVFPCHPVAFEEDLIVVYFEHGGGGRPGCRTMEHAQYRTNK